MFILDGLVRYALPAGLVGRHSQRESGVRKAKYIVV